MVMEDCDAPQNLVVENLSTDPGPQEIQLTWNENVNQEFRYDDGVSTGQLGFINGTTNGVLGAKHDASATLTELSWYLTAEGGPHATVQLYVLGLSTSGMPDANNILYTASVSNTDMQWNTHELPEAIEAEGGFFLGAAYNGFLGLSTDDGVGEPYVYQNGTHYYASDYTTNTWTAFESSGFPVNTMIRATGVANAVRSYAVEEPVYTDEQMVIMKNDTRRISYLPLAEAVKTGAPEYNTAVASANRDRDLLGYNIYKNGELIEALWPENTYTYEEAVADYFCYTVTAEYEFCGESDPSNEACLDVITGMDNISLNNTRVYPNPATNNVVIESAKMNRITVMNAVGQVVIDRGIEGEKHHYLNTSTYEAGVYMIRIETTEGVVTKRLTIVR
jgi:hypothetical protein